MYCILKYIIPANVIIQFKQLSISLPRDATQSAVMPRSVVCPSVCLPVTFRYCDHIGWNISKIISRLISLRLTLGLTPTWPIWCNGNTPKIRVEWGWGNERKNLQYL